MLKRGVGCWRGCVARVQERRCEGESLDRILTGRGCVGVRVHVCKGVFECSTRSLRCKEIGQIQIKCKSRGKTVW